MKPLFAIDLTEDKNNEKMNGEQLLVRALIASDVGGECVLKSTDGETECDNAEPLKSKLSRREKKALRQKAKEEESYDEKTKAAIALSGALTEAYSDVGVPEDAEEVDILSFSYVVKKERIIPVIPEYGYTPYVNLPMKIYVKDRRLYLADLCRVYSFDLESVRSITRVNGRAEFPFWNKPEELDKELAKLYKVKRHRQSYTVKYHYVLTVCEGDEEYSLFFPPYELPIFERLAEVSAQ